MVFVRRSGMGFKLGKRTVNLCRWILRRRTGYLRLESSGHTTSRGSCSAISRLRRWARGLKKIRSRAAEVAAVCFSRAGIGGYRSLNGVGEGEKAVPKGHLAVYVGQKDGDCRRVLVPVVYFNHPLFGQLLREAEEEYGFHHPPGGITIPCRISEFESVRTRVAAVHSGHNRRHHPTLF